MALYKTLLAVDKRTFWGMALGDMYMYDFNEIICELILKLLLVRVCYIDMKAKDYNLKGMIKIVSGSFNSVG